MKRLGLACTALVVWGSAAHAQMAVIDAPLNASALTQIAKQVLTVENGAQQLVQLKLTVNAVLHGDMAALDSLAPQLADLGLTVPLGTDMMQLAQSLSGIANDAMATSALAQQLLSTDQVYVPTAGDFRAIAINQAAVAAANQKALAQIALQSSSDRLVSLNALRSGLGHSPDLKAAADASARLNGEAATTQAQGNQLLATLILQNAQNSTDAAREQQLARCSAERLIDASRRAQAAADGGAVQLVTESQGVACKLPPTTAPSTVAYQTVSYTPGSYVPGTATTAGSGDGAALDTMAAQPWGQQAADNATALGVAPAALAATCVLESNCTANPGGTGTISGAFQMSDGTFGQTVGEVQASNPDLASQITSKNDPASQSIAAAQYLKDGAQALQAAGIANPSVLDVRGYYNFGPANAAQLASASDNQLMSDALPGLSAATLRANGIGDTTTVGAWRAGVTNKIGAATAASPVLQGVQTL